MTKRRPGRSAEPTGRDLLSLEHSPIFSHGPWQIGLLWPNSYETGVSSLGYLWAYDTFNVNGFSSAERYFCAPPTFNGSAQPISLERGTPLSHCDLILVSISYELDLLNLVRMLDAAGIEPLAAHRDSTAPPILIGGPLTRANARALVPFADAVICGDGGPASAVVTEALRKLDPAAAEPPKDALLEALGALPGCGTESSPDPVAEVEPAAALPVVSPLWTPRSALGDLLLFEVSRGCPKDCTFCIGRKDNAPLRMAGAAQVIEAIPEDAPGVGLIGAAVGFYPPLGDLLEWAATNGKRAGVSSMRADRLDKEMVRLLKNTGSEVITVAADGPSERLRTAIGKDITETDLLAAAAHAREEKMNALKVYVMIGLPGETDDDIVELADLANRLNRLLPTILSLSIFVPKRGTPLEQEPFTPAATTSKRLKLLRRHLSGGVRVGRVSPREAALQYLVSHMTPQDGPAIIDIARQGGSFGDWRKVFGNRLTGLLK